MTDDIWADVDAHPQGYRKNRAQRRNDARRYFGRRLRRQLVGFGRWRKGTNVRTGRYSSPFAARRGR